MARICQKCGDPGFQEVMIYCRQCRISCEHKYCLFKFPKKGEKVRWYCEECKPTVFPVSSSDKLEDDTERSKIDLKSVQTPKNQNQIQFQNQNQNQKTKSPSASIVSQLEKVQEKSRSLNPPSSNFGENGQPLKQGTSILPSKDPVNKNLPNTPLFCPAPSTSCGETTVQEEAKSLKSPLLVLGENGQAQKRSHVLSNKDQVNQNISNTPLARSPPPTTRGETIVQEEAKSLRSLPLDFGKNGRFQKQRRSILSNKDQVNQNVPNTPLAHSSPPTTCGETTVEEEAKNVKSPSKFDENGQFQKLRRSILSTKDQVDQRVPNSLLAHSPLPSTCGKTNVHEASAPETLVHRNNTHQEIEVYNPEQVDQIDPYVARPMIYYIWRGCISFGDNNFVPFRAHGSTIAGQRVFDAALLLPPILPVDKYLRRDLCPTIFKNGPPTYESIGLYFLPDDHARGDDGETVASNRIEKARKKDADNEGKMGKISQNVDEAQVSPFSSTCTDEQKAREKTKNFNDSEELEEGEICDDFFGRGEINGSGYDNDADDHCLSLFPLKVEDMGVVSKVGRGAKVSLDLGLGRS